MARRDDVLSCSRMLSTVFCLMLCSLCLAASASGAPFTVSNTNDSGAGSLRQAITDANNSPGSTISITATGTVTLATALPAITADVTISGPGAANFIISGGNSSTVGTIFTIDSGVTASISGLTITKAAGSCGGSSLDYGGGICVDGGTLTVDNIAFINNSANVGGGIYNQGTLTVSNCTFSGNSSTGNGGAIANDSVATVTNGTFFGDSSTSGGGGGIYSQGTSLTVTNSTFDGNSSSTAGAALANESGTMTVANSILTADSQGGECYGNGCPTNGSGGNIVGVSANLAPLGSYGGQTQTMLPLPGMPGTPGSPAICAGIANALATDQRGFPIASTYCTSGKIDSGAVQTNYQSIQFTNAATGYEAAINTAVSFPAPPIVSVTENGQNIGGIPVKLSFTGAPGAATGLGPVPTVAGVGATFSDITVDETGTGALNAQLIPAGTATLNASATLHVLMITLTPAAGALPGATKGAPYSMAFLASGGSTSTYTYTLTVTSGTLPAGMSFSAGTLSGTPTATGTVGFNVTATDSNSFAGTQSYTLTVNPPATATTTKPTVSLTVNQPSVSVMPVTGSGGTTPPALTYAMSSATPLPGGLTMGTSGTITGSPMFTSPATNYTVVVTDVNGSTASSSFSLSVTNGVTATTVIPSKTLTQNQPAITPFKPVTGSGGLGTLKYAMSSATPLPMGLMMDSTGIISGGPTVSAATANYTVVVTDQNGSTASAIFGLTVNTKVTATATPPSTYTLTVSQLAAAFTPVTGSGGTTPPPLTYSISSSTPLPLGLSINSSTGAITGTPTTSSSATVYTVVVTDVNGATGSASFTLAVSSKVVAIASTPSTYTLTQNQPSADFMPVTGSGGTGTLKYSVSSTTPLPANLIINSSTGVITGVPTSSSPATMYTVVVTDQNGATGTAPFTLAVSSKVVATASVPSTYTLTQNQPQITPFMPVTGSGGTTPPALTYAMSSSTPLPMGLSMSSTGMISGSPTVSTAAMSYTVVVTDVNGATGTAIFTLTVSSKVTATAPAPATYMLTVNQPSADFMPVTGSGGTMPLKYAMSSTTPLPMGLSMASTGMITGIPTISSPATSYTVVVTDSNGATASASFTLTVNAAVTATLKIPTETLTAGQPPIPFIPVTGSGGTIPLKYSLTPSSLPDGLTFDGTSGTISGAPLATNSPSTTPYKVTVTDQNGATASQNFTLVVNPAVMAILKTASEILVAGQSLANFKPVTGSGGTGTLMYSVSPSLPMGLSMDSAGAISGSPTLASPPTTYTVTVTDTNGATASEKFSLVVQDFSLALPSAGQINVSQGFSTATDPVASTAMTVTASSSFGFATASGKALILTCTFTPLTGAPTCPATSLPVTPSNPQTPIPLVIDATNATQGAYTLVVTAQDPTTGLTRSTTVTFTVNVSFFTSPPLSVSSGGTVDTMLSFIVPAGVTIPLNCNSAIISPGTPPVSTETIPISCTPSPTSVGTAGSGTVQSVPVTVTINTGSASSHLMTQTGVFTAGLLGVPILALIGYLSYGRRHGRSFFRFLGVISIFAFVLQVIGCGGNFNRTATVTNTTPAGTYYLLVQGEGSDHQHYQAVIQVNVFR